MNPTTDHLVRLDVDYPTRPLDRFSSAFRLLAALPVLAFLATIGGPALGDGDPGDVLFLGMAGGVLFLPPLLTIVFRDSTRAGSTTSTWRTSASTTASSATSCSCGTSTPPSTRNRPSTSSSRTQTSAPSSTAGSHS